MAIDVERLHSWLKARGERKSTIFPGHSQQLERFPPREVTVPEGYHAPYLGNYWPESFGFWPVAGTYKLDLPPIDEEYFETLAALESAIDARDRYTMLEWGAGFGRWTSVSVAAVRECGIDDITVGCVEADPRHLTLCIENTMIMEIPDGRARFYPFALSSARGTDLFVIGKTEYDGIHAWYGQALNNMGEYVSNGRSYYGRPEVQNPLGWRAIEVMVEPASTVLADYDYIDLINIDIQGAEADVIDESITLLNDRARRLHIGTHGAEIEDRLRATLGEHGWLKLWDFPNHTSSDTPYGKIECVDGVQAWFNPRFPPPDYLAEING